MMKEQIKEILRSGFFRNALGNKAVSDILLKDCTVVFLYHEVSKEPSEFHRRYNLNVDPDVFKEQIEIIKSIFSVISPAEFLSQNYKKPAAVITFDDGAKGYFDNALEILRKHNCASIIFLNMGPVHGEIFWSGLVNYLCDYDKKFAEYIKSEYGDEIKKPHFLYIKPEYIDGYIDSNNKDSIYREARKFYGTFATPADLRKCSTNSLVSFGNHLFNHYNSALCSKNELVENYRIGQKEIDIYPNATKLFSYPFGQKDTCYTDETNRLLDDIGAECIFTAHPQNFRSKGPVYHRYAMTESVKDEKQLRMLLSYKRIQQSLESWHVPIMGST
jgi:peptidoglycan/xylan/chitin deacetylase (PgdA/CDA1 family)